VALSADIAGCTGQLPQQQKQLIFFHKGTIGPFASEGVIIVAEEKYTMLT
jgi:hypothetical protein